MLSSNARLASTADTTITLGAQSTRGDGQSSTYGTYDLQHPVPVGEGYDLLLVATPHDVYRNMDLTTFKTPVVDTRHVAPDKEGIVFRA